ncbi:ATP-binding protein [Marinilabiliaceae bacterium ANBcel2]|nr:ATP-binding protein [Marinilabiliaceae bacterium ANBcel2]
MKELTVLSGKGGAGKTTVVAALASLNTNTILCDSDVDSSNLHIIANPQIVKKEIFHGGYKSSINKSVCNGCAICYEYCNFGAIFKSEDGKFNVDPNRCEGCLLCSRVCKFNAIELYQSNNNFWYISRTRFGTMVHASMAPGEDNSGRLVTVVRKKAKEEALKVNASLILNDGPPGIGCPVIASLTGSDMALVVAEPTISGIHDAKRVLELIRKFNISAIAIINKSDINQEVNEQLKIVLKSSGVDILAELPYDNIVSKAIDSGKSVTEYAPDSIVSQKLLETCKELTLLLNRA